MSFKQRAYRTLAAWAAVIAIVVLTQNLFPGDYNEPQREFAGNATSFENQQKIDEKYYRVVQVIDGDTIKVDIAGKVESVRLIGINTPEIKQAGGKAASKYGEMAASYTRNLLQGKRVRLTFDAAPRDRYGRLLAYVYSEQGDFINVLLVRNGYAQVMIVPPNVKYEALFSGLQKEAREARRGLWAIEGFRLENPLADD